MSANPQQIIEFNSMLNRQRRDVTLTQIPMHWSPMAFAKRKNESRPIFMGLEWEVNLKGGICCFDTFIDDSDLTPEEKAVKRFIKRQLNGKVSSVVNFRDDCDMLEMVTIPATLSMHKSLLNKTLFRTDILSLIRPHHSREEAGIHIHVDKDAFEVKHLERFISFINGFETYEFMQKLADRKLYYDDYEAYQNTVKINPTNKSDEHQSDRYSRVNTRTGKNTVEVRIFNSQVTKEKVYARLEFVDALVRYTKNPYAPNRPECFVKYVNRYKSMYKNLLQEPCVKELVRVPIE